jgi:cobyrinic acid a,c-diamide synthase
MIAGTGSGCGKTTLSVSLLAALRSAGKDVTSFKCGPDFIDPMFHGKATGFESRNLDIFLMGENGVKSTLKRHTKDRDIAVIEGVMGLYDGIGKTSFSSSNHISVLTNTPVILAADAKGTALSLCAMIKGYLEFEKNNIQGIILNNTNESMFRFYKEMIEEHLGIRVIGHMPHIPGAEIGSRQLGLIAADEIDDIKEKIEALADQALKSIDISALLDIAEHAGPLECGEDILQKTESGRTSEHPIKSSGDPIKLYIASDEAFCFRYEDNHDLFKTFGAEIRFFSPIQDKELPPDADGLILWGGYQDLHVKRLAENTRMKRCLKKAIKTGLPVYAESGGCVYLMESLTDHEGNIYEMLGVLPGKVRMAEKLQNFGYHELEARKDSLLCRAGDRINAHFFNHFENVGDEGEKEEKEENIGGDCFIASKNEKSFFCIVSKDNIFAGLQHLHFQGNPGFAENFIKACREYSGRKKNGDSEIYKNSKENNVDTEDNDCQKNQKGRLIK